MSAWFETVFGRVIGHEGRFQKHPGDRGNWTTGIVGRGLLKGTNWGISAATYPELDIENMSRDEAKLIYFTDWWERMGMRYWPEALSYQMFDAAINHGMQAANKMLQRALSVDDDGIIGPRTLEALQKAHLDDLLKLFLAERLEFFTNLGTFDTFGRGWARRIAQNLRYAAKDTPNERSIGNVGGESAGQGDGLDLPRPGGEAKGTRKAFGTRAKWPDQAVRGFDAGDSDRGGKS